MWCPALVLRPARWVSRSRGPMRLWSRLSRGAQTYPGGVLCDARENGACLYTTQSTTTTTTEAVPVVSESAFERGGRFTGAVVLRSRSRCGENAPVSRDCGRHDTCRSPCHCARGMRRSATASPPRDVAWHSSAPSGARGGRRHHRALCGARASHAARKRAPAGHAPRSGPTR